MPDEVELIPQIEFQRRALDRAVLTCVRAWPLAREETAQLGFPSSTAGAEGRTRSGASTEGGPTARLAVEWVELPWLDSRAVVSWLAELADVIDAFAGTAVWVGHSDLWVAVHWRLWAGDYASTFPAGRRDRRCWNVLPDRLFRLADRAGSRWLPPPEKGSVVGGVTVGERSNQTVTCDLCGDPIAATHADPVRKVPDGHGGHKNLHRSPCWYTWTTDQGLHPRQLKVVKEVEGDA